jgi:hypothetical protein
MVPLTIEDKPAGRLVIEEVSQEVDLKLQQKIVVRAGQGVYCADKSAGDFRVVHRRYRRVRYFRHAWRALVYPRGGQAGRPAQGKMPVLRRLHEMVQSEKGAHAAAAPSSRVPARDSIRRKSRQKENFPARHRRVYSIPSRTRQ